MPFRQINTPEMIEHAKDVGIGIAGIVTIKIPAWFEFGNELFLNADGYYKFSITVATICAIYARHKYMKQKN